MVRFDSLSTSALAPMQLLTPEVMIVGALGIIASTPLLGQWVRAALALEPERSVHISANRLVLGQAAYLVGLLALFALAVISLAAGTYNPFIYFRF